MKRFSRREMLRASGIAVGTAWALGSGTDRGFASPANLGKSGRPDIKFPTATRERLAVASWPFRGYIESAKNEDRDRKLPGMDLREFAVRVMETFGVPGVEPLSTHFPSTDAAYLHGFREAIEKAGVHVVNIPVDNQHSYYEADPAVRKQAVTNGKSWVDVALILGSPSVRTSIAEAKNAKPSVDVAADEIRRLVEYAAAKNVVVNLENDNLVSEDAFFVVKVIERVNSPYLHALPDFCNSMQSGDEKFNYDAVTAMFGRAYNICHVKDSEVNDAGKVYRVNLKKSFRILQAVGYRGYCSMEWEGGGDPYVGTRKLLAASLENLA
jgi:sugar phosphate isomerase/epimerase